MRKIIAVLCITVIALFTSTVQAQQQEPQEKLINDAFITALNPYISNAVYNYYNEVKQYGLYDAKILEIKRESEGGFSFIVKVQVTTFEASHNPPYGTETITMKVDPSGVKVMNYEHKGDEWEQKIKKFNNDVLMDIQKTFNLDLNGYQKYESRQIFYQAEQDRNLKQLANFNEDIVINVLNKEFTPPHKNVTEPFTFVKDDKAYIVYKKADGTNILYTLRKENSNWVIIKKETKQGKVMPKELLWYMFKRIN